MRIESAHHRCSGRRWRLGLGCALLLWPLLALAAVPRNLHFDTLGTEQGLAQETALAIVQDRQGFIWIGTQGGLCRFDGYRVFTYRNDPADAGSLADNRVNALYDDEQGRLWVGTRGGLQQFDARSDRFIRHLAPDAGTQDPAAVDVRALAGDGHGGLWIATRDGLQHLDPASGALQIWRHDPAQADSLVDDEVWALAPGPAGELWIGTEAGLDRLMPNQATRQRPSQTTGTTSSAATFQHFRVDDPQAPNPKRNAVWALLPDADDSLWIGSFDGLELWHFGGGEPQRRRFDAATGLAPGTIASILRDRDRNVWIGTVAQGLLRWDEASGRFIACRHHAEDPHSLADNDIPSLYQDRSGSLWAGTWYGGVSRTDLGSGGFERYVQLADSGAGLSDNRVGGIAGDAGGIWLATLGGLDRVDRASGSISVFRHNDADPHSLGDDATRAVFVDRAGRLWIGTSTGLDLYDAATRRFSVRHFSAGASGDDSIFFIGSDGDQGLWIGTYNGLHEFDPATGAVRSFHHDPADAGSIDEGVVRDVKQDGRGDWWVATGGGLDRLDRVSGRFTHFRHDPKDPDSISDDHVGNLFVDRNGVLWIGTANGLDRMVRTADGRIRFQAWTTRDGLGDDLIGSIRQDTAGRLWISTAAGLSRFDPNSGEFRNYTAADGLVDGTFLIGSAWRDNDGSLYFGSFRGLTAFHPDAIRDNSTAPQVAITDLQIFGRSIIHGVLPRDVTLDGPLATASKLKLPYRDPVFSLEFSALHFSDPARNRYAYQLDGFDRDWTAVDASRRFVTYTHLDPGNYVFRVKAANKDGVWSTADAALAITITPPFWKTGWFIAATAATLLGTAVLAYRARVRGLRRRQQALEQQVALRTAEAVQQRVVAEQKQTEAELQHAEVRRQKDKVELAHQQLQDMQKQLVQHEKLASVGRLVTGLAHEINTPLGNIRMSASVISERVETLSRSLGKGELRRAALEDFIDVMRQSGTVIERASGRTDELISNLKELAVDPASLHARRFDVADTLDLILHSMAHHLIKANAEVTMVAEHGIELLGDAGRFEQVIVNLLANAMMHGFEGRDGGHIAIDVRRRASAIEIAVSDDGAGMPPDLLEKIFEPFFTTRFGHGSAGLGLYVVHNIVTSIFSGTIRVDSTVGAGTTFTINLPFPG